MKAQIIELRKKGMSYKDIVDTLGCSKGTVSYHCSKMDDHDEVVLKNTRIRSDAQRLEVWEPLTEYQELWFRRLTEMSINKTEVADVLGLPYFQVLGLCRAREIPFARTPKKTIIQRVQRRHWRLKALSVAYKGGCCVRCGFDHMGALVFHHRNPSEKNFQISGGGIRSWPRIKKELNKCDILCANCHGEIHAEITRASRPEKKPGMCKNATCTSPLPPSKRGSPRKYCSKSCGQVHNSASRKSKCTARAIDYKGGECARCGHSKSRYSLEFHHRDPSEKSFRVSNRIHYKWDTVRDELDKCDLLCSNCHRIEHGEYWKTVDW